MQMVVPPWGMKVNTYATCRVIAHEGPILLSFGTQFDYMLETRTGNDGGGNYVSNLWRADPAGSLWWAVSILGTYYVRMARNMSRQFIIPANNSANLPQGRIRKANLHFRRNSNVTDILDPHHLYLAWYMIYEKPNTRTAVYWAGNHSRQYATDLKSNGTFPNNWWADSKKLAKSAYSTVLVDLGQSDSSSLLLDGEKLQSFAADFNASGRPGYRPCNQSLENDQRLNTTPATLQATYICNRPRRKNTRTIVWLIILADIVFLEALWVVYKQVIDTWLVGSMVCERCDECIFHSKEWS